MKEQRIAYRAGYKYQLAETYSVQTVLFGYDIETAYTKLYQDGLLIIKKGYAWDGPSGPTVDTKNFMRGSLIHDVLYQLLREGLLPQHERFIADKILQIICREDGMCKARAWWVFQGVHKFASGAADPHSKKKIIHAP